MSIELSSEQQIALDNIKKWVFDGHSKSFVLGGLAGTGKTTLIRALFEALSPRLEIAIASFTGKAVHILRKKGLTEAQTLHSFLYTAEKLPDGSYSFTRRPSSLFPQDLVIVDEASMVSRDLYNDLRSLPFKVLYVGDHGQLEPVGDNPNLMKHPDLVLEHIHRQAAESPIIRFAHLLRQGFAPTYSTSFDDPALTIRHIRDASFDDTWQLICAFNAKRCVINRTVRSTLNRSGLIVPGDRIICLRNNVVYSIFNGMMAVVDSVSFRDDYCFLSITTDDGRKLEDLPVVSEAFGFTEKVLPEPRWHPKYKRHEFCYFDYGYCITGHKSQGSEWPRVCVFEDHSRLWSMPRWRYTVATRASESLQYLTDKGLSA